MPKDSQDKRELRFLLPLLTFTFPAMAIQLYMAEMGAWLCSRYPNASGAIACEPATLPSYICYGMIATGILLAIRQFWVDHLSAYQHDD